MSAGSSTPGAAVPIDVGGTNTFTRTDSTVGAGQPYWSAWWTFTPDTDGFLVLDTSDTEGTGLVDTLLNIRRDSSANAPFAGDDDSGDGPAGRASRISVDVFAGVAYWIKVGSFSTDGDGITIYHLAAAFTEIPTLPNPRAFTIPGGSLTDHGVVMGPGVVAAPRVPPLSVSTPTDGSLPDATFVFDATTWLATIGVDSAWITLDATLSYLTDGTCDSTAPEVGLNLFHVNHAFPFTWEEDWDTDFIGNTDGTDDYGREVPRGQSQWLVETGRTYIIQLTTPPGNAVRFALRVGDFGPHTAPTTIPDQTVRVTGAPWSPDDAGGDPVTYGPATVYAKASPDGLSLDTRDIDTVFPNWSLSNAFAGDKSLSQGFGAAEPGGDLDAIVCAWVHARRGKAPFDWWTSDRTVDGGDPGSCAPLSDHESGGLVGDGRVGYHYQSDAAGLFPGSAGFDVFDAQHRLRVTGLLEYFGATAGVDPATLTAPDGYELTNPLLSASVFDPPELLGVQIAMDQYDAGATSTTNPTRMFVSAVSYDNDDGSSDPWGPVEDATLGSEAWRGTTNGPESYADGRTTFDSPTPVTVPLDTVWQAALDDEARADDSGGPTYQGGLSVVGLFDAQLTDALPSPTPAGVVGESITDESTYQYPVLLLQLRPTTTYRFADYSMIPAVVVSGGPIRLLPRDDETGIFSSPRMWPPSKSGARLFGAPP